MIYIPAWVRCNVTEHEEYTMYTKVMCKNYHWNTISNGKKKQHWEKKQFSINKKMNKLVVIDSM